MILLEYLLRTESSKHWWRKSCKQIRIIVIRVHHYHFVLQKKNLKHGRSTYKILGKKSQKRFSNSSLHLFKNFLSTTMHKLHILSPRSAGTTCFWHLPSKKNQVRLDVYLIHQQPIKKCPWTANSSPALIHCQEGPSEQFKIPLVQRYQFWKRSHGIPHAGSCVYSKKPSPSIVTRVW